MWQSALENAKLIIGTIMITASLLAGTWTLTTSVFLTKAEAQNIIGKLDIDTSYNKAFRLEEKIKRLKRKPQPLDQDDTRSFKRLEKDLQRVDDHIDFMENKIYKDDDV